MINCSPNTSVKYHKRRNKTIKILNTKIPTDPCKMAIFPYSLQKPKNPYRRDFSLRVASLNLSKAGKLSRGKIYRNNSVITK